MIPPTEIEATAKEITTSAKVNPADVLDEIPTLHRRLPFDQKFLRFIFKKGFLEPYSYSR